MSHRSPCFEPVVDYMRGMHEKKFIHPSAYFLQRRLLSGLLW